MDDKVNAGAPAMQYIDILGLTDGKYHPEARVWEDGRFDSQPHWVGTLMGHGLYDPVTGVRQARGPGLIRAIRRSFNNGYIATGQGCCIRGELPAYLLPETRVRGDSQQRRPSSDSPGGRAE